MIKLLNESKYLFEMSNIRGKFVKNPHRLNFSFYFSPKDGVESKELCHGLRVKPIFNPEKMSIDLAGTLKLHGDWKYIPGKEDGDVSSKDIRNMKKFFADYKILFAAVWEKKLSPDALYDYFRGTFEFSDLTEDLTFYKEYKNDLDMITDCKALHDFVVEHDLFNTWDV